MTYGKKYKVVVEGFLDPAVAEFFVEHIKKGLPDSLTVTVDDYYDYPEPDYPDGVVAGDPSGDD